METTSEVTDNSEEYWSVHISKVRLKSIFLGLCLGAVLTLATLNYYGRVAW